jgi:hypothetical protein
MKIEYFLIAFLVTLLVFSSAASKTFLPGENPIDNDKLWVEDTVKKIRYMRKVVILNNRKWVPDNNELNFQITSVTLKRKKDAEITTKVRYGGGCKTHRFQLVRPYQTSKDTLQLFLIHEANGDNCRAFVNNEMTFDATKLKLKKNKKVLMINNFKVE